MEHHERADELDRETDDAAERSERLEREIEETRSNWEAKKSDPSAPGATEPEASGAHQLESEDPVSGEAKGDERQAEVEDAARTDAEREDEER